MNFIDIVTSRLKEPSTWLGLGTLVTAVGWNISPELWQSIATVGMGLGGLLAVVMAEKGRK